MSPQKSQLRNSLRRLRLDDGDIVLVKVDGDPSSDRWHTRLSEIADIISETGHANLVVIGVKELDDIATLNPVEMAKLGWFRAPQMTKLVAKKPPALRIHYRKDADDDEIEEGN